MATPMQAWGRTELSPRGYALPQSPQRQQFAASPRAASPRAASPSILREPQQQAQDAARHGFRSSPSGGWYRADRPKRVDLGGRQQTRKQVREYVPGERPTAVRAAEPRRAGAETREWKKHLEQSARPLERSLRTSPDRNRRRAPQSDREVRLSPTRRAVSPRRSVSPMRDTRRAVGMERRAGSPSLHAGRPLYSPRTGARSPLSHGRVSRSPSPQRRITYGYDQDLVTTAGAAAVSSALPCVSLGHDTVVAFKASWMKQQHGATDPADPQLDLQVLQFGMGGEMIKEGLLDAEHPRTEWQIPGESDWRVTATHTGDRSTELGSWQEATIELSEVAPNVHSIYFVVTTRRSLHQPLSQVDSDQLELSTSGGMRAGRALPCELPALSLRRGIDTAVVARLVRTRGAARWGCQPLPLRVEPLKAQVAADRVKPNALLRIAEAVQAFLRQERMEERRLEATDRVVYDSSPLVGRQALVARGGSPTRGIIAGMSPRRAARAPDGGRATYDLGMSTPVKLLGGWQDRNPLDISLLMFGWENTFLPDTHLDRTREAIEWCFDEDRAEWQIAATHSGDLEEDGRGYAGSQELIVYPDTVSHSVQAVFFVVSGGEKRRLEQLRGVHARLWQGASLLHSFDASYVGMATSMVLACMVRDGPRSPWQLHALDVPCFSDAGGRGLSAIKQTCMQWLDETA